MRIKVKKFLTLLLVFVLQFMYAQERTISGVVTDETGGLPGVSVLKKGTTSGTETDFDGKYSLKAKTGDVLVFSFVGMKTVEKTVGASNNIDVVMQNDNVLDEVVVVGYGTQSKRKLTDNIVKLDSKDLADVPTPSVMNSLAGKATGVKVVQTNGKVEGGLSFNIRGQSSISAGSEPLYVLDGMPLINDNESSNGAPTNPLLTLSSNEIESIDILKDASAASIYGARGANGVVIITTKKGKEGKAKFNVNLSNGISVASNKREWLNADEYIELFSEAAENGKTVNGWPVNGKAYAEGRFDRYSNGTWRERKYDTDWQEEALRVGYTRDVNFSVSGGSAKTSYFFSTTYNDTKGIVRGNGLEKIGARVNISHKLLDKLTLGSSLSFSRAAIDRIANDNAFVTPLQAIALSPISPTHVDGEPYRRTTYANFLLEDKYSNYKTTIKRVTGNLTGKYDFTSSLSFNTNFGYDLYLQTEDQFRGRKAPFQSTNGQAFASNVDSELYNISNYFAYDKNFDNNHNLNLVIGTEFSRGDRRFTSVTGTQFPEEGFQSVSSAASITAGKGSFTSYSFLSYFGRATYSLMDRYLLKVSYRRDGSSRFGKDKKWGDFMSASLGWIISEEDFLRNNETLSFLKLRGSYGTLGNSEIGNFRSLNLFGAFSYNKQPGISLTQAGDSSLGWEVSNQLDLGLEYGFFNNRISGDVVYYNKDTRDLLFRRSVPRSSGATSITQNIGRLVSKGLEFSLKTKNVMSENFNWTTNFNLGQNKNEVVSLPNGVDQISGRNILREGEPVNSFYLKEYAGVDSDNGDALYYKNTKDANGNLDKTTTNDVSEAQRIVAGNPSPEWIAGMTNTMTYKDFDFSFTLGGEWGASVYNNGGRFQSANGDWFDNQTKDQLNRWQKPGDITNVPQARLGGGNGTSHSTRYLQNVDFIRLRNVSLGYSLPKNVINKVGFEKVRLYVSGLNLLTFTDYDGYDPESRADAGNSVGEVFYSAPSAKTFSLGINLGF